MQPHYLTTLTAICVAMMIRPPFLLVVLCPMRILGGWYPTEREACLEASVTRFTAALENTQKMCHKPCSAYGSTLILNAISGDVFTNTVAKGGTAGMRDREWVFETIGQLAEATCSRFVVPPPCMLLHLGHAKGR